MHVFVASKPQTTQSAAAKGGGRAGDDEDEDEEEVVDELDELDEPLAASGFFPPLFFGMVGRGGGRLRSDR